jgi:hypothetical protein
MTNRSVSTGLTVSRDDGRILKQVGGGRPEADRRLRRFRTYPFIRFLLTRAKHELMINSSVPGSGVVALTVM